MRLRLNDPSLVADLATFLQRGGLTVGQDGADTLWVTARSLNEAARDEANERVRIIAEVRGWLTLHRSARVDFLSA